MMERTQDVNGVIQGTFNGNTTPTDSQVTALMSVVAPDVYSQIPAIHNPDLEPLATFVAAIGVAMWVELSFWPEVSKDPESPFALLKERFEMALGRLKEQAAIEAEGGQLGTEGDVPLPLYSFPQVYPDGAFTLPAVTTMDANF